MKSRVKSYLATQKANRREVYNTLVFGVLKILHNEPFYHIVLTNLKKYVMLYT